MCSLWYVPSILFTSLLTPPAGLSLISTHRSHIRQTSSNPKTMTWTMYPCPRAFAWSVHPPRLVQHQRRLLLIAHAPLSHCRNHLIFLRLLPSHCLPLSLRPRSPIPCACTLERMPMDFIPLHLTLSVSLLDLTHFACYAFAIYWRHITQHLQYEQEHGMGACARIARKIPGRSRAVLGDDHRERLDIERA